jgi:hypothetical protein
MELFSRLRNSFRKGAADPVRHYGSTYEGTYEPVKNQISGFVTDPSEGKRYPPASIVVILGGEVVASTGELEQSGRGWRFKIAVSTDFTADDVLQERIKVLATDHRGSHSALRIDGAVQLGFIRDVFAPAETEIVIEFGLGGNSVEYVQEGWSGQEPQHTWTEGRQSTIVLPLAAPGARYGIEILAWPFVSGGKIPGQTVRTWIGSTLIHTFHVRSGQQLLECELSSEVSQAGIAIIRFELPDAASPHDIDATSPDGRILGLAFRRLKLKRYLETPAAFDLYRRRL